MFFSQPVYTVEENDTMVEVCVELEGNLERTVSLNLTALDLTSDTATGTYVKWDM